MQYSLNQIKKDNVLIKMVNKIYHDVEAEVYEDIHPEIYKREEKAWNIIFKKYIPQGHKNLVVVDIGTGVGFIPSVMSCYLSEKDELIFTDISEKMLEVVRKKFDHTKFKKTFIACDSSNIPLKSRSVDFITVNSVLHHFPDSKIFFQEVDRILRPGGLFIVRHEPNKLFAGSALFRFLFHTIKSIQNYRYHTGKSKKNNSFQIKILKNLKEADIEFFDEVTQQDIQSIVDIESPTSHGGLDQVRGFDPIQIKKKYFKEYKKIDIHTYGFFGKIDDQKTFIRRSISKVLEKLFPRNGYMFHFIIQK